MNLWKTIKKWAIESPDRAAIAICGKEPLSFSRLRDAILLCVDRLPEVKNKRVACFIRNRPLWGIYDIALTLKGAITVPLPIFFSKEQLKHIIDDAGIDLIITESKAVLESMMGPYYHHMKTEIISADPSLESAENKPILTERNMSVIEEDIPAERVVKIIYTSGSTGRPKGVMIRLRGIESAAASLIKRSRASSRDRYVSLLPLSTLLETIGGLYVPLMVGAQITYPPLSNANAVDNILPEPDSFLDLLSRIRPSCLIIVPHLIKPLLLHCKRKPDILSSFRFIACGGAHIQSSLMDEVRESNLPLYEGYGLSELSSVVSLNGVGANRPGSAGKPLDHLKVYIDKDGEIVVRGNSIMAGYVKDGEREIDSFHTGDIGYLDEDGYLYITGRKDSLFSTALGRTLSPEWLERELLSLRSIKQAMIWGEEKPFISALIVPDEKWLMEEARRLPLKNSSHIISHPSIKDAILSEITDRMERFPPYARVRSIAVIDKPFTPEDGLLTPNGRLKRKEIYKRYSDKIEELYKKDKEAMETC